MARASVEFHPAAAEEAVAAFEWYKRRSEAAARAFQGELDLGIEAITANPHIWPRFAFETRRYLLPKFPFALIYRIAGEVLTIIAVAHGRRRPGDWRRR
jgi:plasmid stabilization system protein ParE